MTNNQIDLKQDPNELSDDELASVSGGGAIGEIVDATNDFVTDLYKTGKELVSDIGETIEKTL